MAVHEFLGKRALAHRIESVISEQDGFEHYQSAFSRKEKLPEIRTRWTGKWMQRLCLAMQDIAALIPPGDAFILVDQGEFGGLVTAGRRIIPFIEREGRYWGPPSSDDETAIREFERFRQTGAAFMVFAWPAFWWLCYYDALGRHLCSAFRCILENDRLVVFDLRQ